MSAQEKVNLPFASPKIGILAGGAALPQILSAYLEHKNVEVFVSAFNGQGVGEWVHNYNHAYFDLGKVGALLKKLKAESVSDVCLIGAIKRPDLKSLKPDLEGAKLLTKLATQGLGDNSALCMIRDYLQDKGFSVWGVHELMPDLLAPKGVVGDTKPSKQNHKDIEFGIDICQTIGRADIGQSVIVENGVVLGVEAIEGTDELIKRCASLKRAETGGVLIKMIKPQQDPNLDMPTIGIQTLENLKQSGFDGVAVSAKKTLIPDLKECCKYATDHKLFIYGIE